MAVLFSKTKMGWIISNMGGNVKMFLLLIFLSGCLNGCESQLTSDFSFSIDEGRPPNSLVGAIPVSPGSTYRFSVEQTYFIINSTSGEIRTKVEIDREELPVDEFDISVLEIREGLGNIPIEINIVVNDINDNAPSFSESEVQKGLSESALVGARISLPSVSDPDLGDNGTILDPVIVSGNNDSTFGLQVINFGSTILRLNLMKRLDRETKDFYQLRILARDNGSPSLSSFLIVNVTVSDVNDNPPVFEYPEYRISLNESTEAGTVVLQVTASDNDTGRNGEIIYYLPQSNSHFSVDPESGFVTLTNRLVYEDDQFHSFKIEAMDKGSPSQLGRTDIYVDVIDINDHDPDISVSFLIPSDLYASVEEGAQNGSVVALVTVRDADQGDNGAVNLQITSGNEMGHFQLQPIPSLEGIFSITVIGMVDREVIAEYNITLFAEDLGTPRRSSMLTVLVVVLDANDHAPVFESSSYSADLAENAPAGSYVSSVSATDMDTGVNAEVSYSITGGNDLGWFQVDPLTGLVTTTMVLDRETTSSVLLNVTAIDHGRQPLMGTVALTVTIRDVNDVVPLFLNDSYQATVPENAGADIFVTTVTATDQDEGDGGIVRYSFADDSLHALSMFEIDPVSGVITTLVSIDREEIAQVSLSVKAKDLGANSLFSLTMVNVEITDENDNNPIFYPEEYFVSVNENEDAGTHVVTVTATDADINNNGKVTYFMSNNAGGNFKLKNTSSGEIFTARVLDREVQSIHTVTVLAVDGGGLEAPRPATVFITIGDIQDNPPSFQRSSYSFDVLENVPSNTYVGSVLATSEDLAVNVSYRISSGDPGGQFKINSETGEIRTLAEIDRESTPSFALKVFAHAASLIGETTVNVQINDVNDNAPDFGMTSDSANVVENWSVGHQVYWAQATDPDVPPNSLIAYELSINPGQYFDIDPSSGWISIHSDLQSASQDEFTLEVRATDHGTPQMSSTLTLVIHLRDVNGHDPVFQEQYYIASISEDTKPTTRFIHVLAEDADQGTNGVVSYNITSGNEENRFGIFPDGQVYVRTYLDRETTAEYLLTITATDEGVPRRSAATPLSVTILDENDHRPVFTNSSYNFYMAEEQTSVIIGMVEATDQDAGANGEVRYAIITNDTDFVIGIHSGILSSGSVFNREELELDVFMIVVEAYDGGDSPLRERININIHVTDINDNAPEFLQSNYMASISELATPNTNVITVFARDSDLGDNSYITYSIVSGNLDDVFRINHGSGQISVRGTLDRETTSSYSLMVQARDAGTPSLSTITDVTLTILDENDHPPVFQDAHIQVEITECVEIDDLVTSLIATDADEGQNKLVSYSIVQGNARGIFRVDPNSGDLYLAKLLDHETDAEYHLNISAQDSGTPHLNGYASVVVIVRDCNDNAPTFSQTNIVKEINEELNPGTEVATVLAEDFDSGINGVVHHSILSQMPDMDFFQIDLLEGVISIRNTIDRETLPEASEGVIQVVVQAIDQALPRDSRQSATATVTFIVRDVNDNRPEIVSQTAAAVQPGSSVNTHVTTVVAVDEDSGDNAALSFSLLTPQVPFSIDPSTGVVTVSGPIVSSASPYSLLVRVQDRGSQPLASEIMLSVIVTESVSTGPVFSQSSYTAQIEEERAVGTPVMTVTASYADGRIAPIEYYITSTRMGNLDSRNYFTITKTSGIISTSAVIDRETLNDESVFSVTVTAADVGATPPRTRNVEVLVTILDINDNPPSFQGRVYNTSVSENTGTDTPITQVQAVDPDTFTDITYAITSGSDGIFSIDPEDGQIMLEGALDREVKDGYQLTVRASDGELSSTTLVAVNVLDQNDNSPLFSESVYSFSVREDETVPFAVDRIIASDLDEGSNSAISYRIVREGAPGEDVFDLNAQSGELTLIQELDYEEKQLYYLKVEASDQGQSPLTSTAVVYVSILDVNDNDPVFEPQRYSVEVSESVDVGTELVTVSATDLDSDLNGYITYSIHVGDSSGRFAIHSNGTITVAQPLDRESQSFYNLEVRAQDSSPEGPRSGSAQVSVIVSDINDNAPTFTSPPEVHVLESASPGSVVMTISAEDPDVERNSYIEYSLDPPPEDEAFIVGPVDGSLLVWGNLDRESQPSYNLSVLATDKGIPPRSSMMVVTVILDDVNDNNPSFETSSYHETIPENIPVGIEFLQVKAEDPDIGPNAWLTYTITGGNYNSDFTIDIQSGVISVAKSLDRERRQSYTLTIRAQDSGPGSRFSMCEVVIDVEDVNDNSPTFLDEYRPTVVENNRPQELVVQVSADDADEGHNGALTYSLQGNTYNGLFVIDRSTGVIRVTRQLDHEAADEYALTVVAEDGGLPQLIGTTQVIVTVGDTNDNPTLFSSDEYRTSIDEEVPLNTVVIQVSASDADSSAMLRYRLSDEVANKFTIYPLTGHIVTAGRLDREEQSSYQLVVTVTDGEETVASTTVFIAITDIDDNQPEFESSSYQVRLPENANAGTLVVVARATDADVGLNAENYYSIESGDTTLFGINQSTGAITVSRNLSGQTGDFIIRVAVRDAIDAPEPDDVATVFVTFQHTLLTSYPAINLLGRSRINVAENEPPGEITTVRASSPKDGSVGDVTFHIAGGNEGGLFSLDSSSGVLRTVQSLDFESEQEYHLWIEARDSDTPPLSSFSDIIIAVLDLNDNSPLFEEDHYFGHITEGASSGQEVLQVMADDLDSGSFGNILYSIRTNQDNAFRISETSGWIYTTKVLDREAESSYEITVEAQDAGSPAKVGTTLVTISVDDINDNPMFLSEDFQGSIEEDALPGTFVMTISTEDRDENAISKFRITGGNPGGAFAIDEETGDIRVNRSLDHESDGDYQLAIQAFDDVFTLDVPVTIRILDVNDNPPVFDSDGVYRMSIPELQPTGTFVLTVSATDRDEGDNGRVRYQMKSLDSPFNINAISGDITVARTLEYQKFTFGDDPNIYQFDVLAVDHGSPTLYSEVAITVEVYDANDHAPVFDSLRYFSPVPTGTQSSVNIIRVTAVDDLDEGINAEVSYFVISGNGTSRFQVDERTGWVRVLGNVLEGSVDTRYSLVIQAQDGGRPTPLSATTIVDLLITSANIHAPQFTQNGLTVLVGEDQPLGRITTLRATDLDPGVNGDITYSITAGNEMGLFSIGASSGEIILEKNLDYEEVTSHVLEVTASDGGWQVMQTTNILTVTVDDRDDNPPMFQQREYFASVPENTASAEYVTNVVAVDVDSPRFAQFTYAIIGGDGQNFFTVNENDGVIRTQGNLDYEQGQQEFVVTVTAANEDGSHRDTCHVYIEVTGVNEYSPQYLQQEYVFSVSEGAPDGTPVGSVLAVDSDDGQDGEVLYLLIGASNEKGFSINAETGQIIIDRENGILDRETQEEVTLSVLAKNEGPLTGANIDETKVVIHIVDANDAPVFTPDIYTASVREDADPQTYITTVTAVEYDQQPAFRQFVYTFLEDADDDLFDIDPTTGRVTLSGALDRETSAVYHITVAAVDTGVPPMTGTAQVVVSVEDVNDNGPVLLGDNAIGRVTENQAPNTYVMTLNATDPDSESNPAGFRFRLLSSSDAFFLDYVTGELKTIRRLNREDQSEYLLDVEISDGGSPIISARSTLRIIVEDENDQLSSSRNGRIEVKMYRSAFPGGSVGSVAPIDGDLSDEFQCEISSGDRSRFQILPGCILHAEPQTLESQYTVNVTGGDGAHPSVLSSFVVSFQAYSDATIEASVTIQLANLHAEEFLAAHYDRFLAAVSSILPSRQELIVLSLTDVPDAGLNVLLAVKKIVGYVSREDLVTLLTENEGSIATRAEVTIEVVDYTACVSSPCLNQGLCNSHHNIDYSPVAVESIPVILVGPTSQHTFTCDCGGEYFGDRCELQINQCDSDPCFNSISCNDLVGDYSCVCIPGYHGKRCQTNIDECSSAPCQNGGRCADLVNGYRCECLIGYSGSNCQDGPCAQDPCMNAGQCTESGSHFKCECSYGFWGTRCEFASISFQSGSFMQYPSLGAAENSLIMEFATTLSDVLLVYNHDGTTQQDGHLFVLEVIDGQVHFSFNLGVGIVTMMTERRVDDGQWHRLQAIRKAQNGELFILDEACNLLPERACRATGVSGSLDQVELSLKNSPLFVGGVDNVEQLTQRPWQTSSVEFVGCMRQISINGRDQNIATAIRSQGVSEGCARSIDGVCGASTCSRGDGVCVDDWWGSWCSCDSGDTCQLESVPSSFGGDSFVEYQAKEGYQRQQLLKEAKEGSRRKKRATTGVQELKLSFRTGDADGVLLLIKSGQKFTLLEVEDAIVRYSYGIGDYSQGTILMDGVKVDDWRWHNLTLEREERSVTLQIDDSGKTRNFVSGGLPHDFTGVDVDMMTLGGTPSEVVIDEQRLQGFAGCIHQFVFDGEPMPLSGATERFTVTPSESIGSGCSPVDPCATSPCAAGQSCTSLGTGFTCFIPPCMSSPCMNGGACIPGAKDSFKCDCAKGYQGDLCAMINAPSVGNQGLPTDIIIIGLIAAIVIIILVFVVFTVILLRRKGDPKPEPKPKTDNGMYTSSNSMDNPTFVNHDTFDDATMIGYGDGKLHSDRPSSLHQMQPDIIDQNVHGSRVPSRNSCNSPADELDQLHYLPQHFPEHYDIENASSIAPSDIDVAYHYRHYHDRDARRSRGRRSPNPMLARIQASPSRESPLTISRQSPNPFINGVNPHPGMPGYYRQSPNVMVMQNMNGGIDLRRAASPYNGRLTPVGSEHSELRSLAHRSDVSSVRSRAKSPMSGMSAASRPKSHVSDVSARRRTQSPVSHISNRSHHSRKSHRRSDTPVSDVSARRRSDTPLSHVSNHSRHSKRSHRSGLHEPARPLGLTAEEVARLNSARPDLMTGSHTSTIDNLSSISGEANVRQRKSLLERGDSSSGDESAASFTCSEPDLDTSTYIMTKLASIEDLQSSRLNSDGAGSQRFSSEEENDGSRAPEPTFSLDQLLNWGPNFQSLSPVCEDLAMLNDLNADKRAPKGHSKSRVPEEFV